MTLRRRSPTVQPSLTCVEMAHLFIAIQDRKDKPMPAKKIYSDLNSVKDTSQVGVEPGPRLAWRRASP
jgi:hypothetical protein